MSEITLDVGLAYKIKQALFRNGITDVADLDWLATGDNIAKMRRVRLGYAEIVVPENIIDCDAAPLVPDGWEVVEHQCRGSLKWVEDVQEGALYLSERQRNGNWIGGEKLCRELEGQPVLNANVLDHLLTHSHLIPEGWKGMEIFFWGTVYRGQRGNRGQRGKLCVRGMAYSSDRWVSISRAIVSYWGGSNVAAVRAPEAQQG